MKVGELIDLLRMFPPDIEVAVDDPGDYGLIELIGAERVGGTVYFKAPPE